MTDFDDMLKRAEDGDPTAQGFLAHAFFNGEGVADNKEVARYWLLKAVAGKDPWSLTVRAIELRSMGDPTSLTESARLLEIAAGKGNAVGHFTLGLHLLEGIGIEKDAHRGVAELLMASFAGSTDAAELFNKYKVTVSEKYWPLVFDHVRWPILTFVMGPLVDGHLDGLTQNRLEDDGTNNAPWLQYERKVADGLFVNHSENNFALDQIFGDHVTINSILVGRAIVAGQPVAATSISFGNVLLPTGYPPFYRPTDDALNFVTSTIGGLEARKWVRWMYQSF
jgi:hypothetical protein